MSLKKAWITPNVNDLASLSLESSSGTDKSNQIYINELSFPVNPTPDNPKKHVINLGLFDIDELIYLRNIIDGYLLNEGKI